MPPPAAGTGPGPVRDPGYAQGGCTFAQGPGETLGDRVSTHRGMSIKVFGVPGEKLPGHDVETQDFVLATGTTFPSGTAAGFLRDGTVIGKATGLPEGVKSAVAATARNLNRVLHTFGTESAMADFFGHPYSHPLADSLLQPGPDAVRRLCRQARSGARDAGAAGPRRMAPRPARGRGRFRMPRSRSFGTTT